MNGDPRVTGWVELSPCERYRYALGRTVDASLPGSVLFVMLNPSTADALVDDPTIRRCIGFTRRWGFGELLVGNLFAMRETQPKNLAIHEPAEAIGPHNEVYLANLVRRASLVVAAWGIPPRTLQLSAGVAIRRLSGLPMVCLGKTKDGSRPRHPLYVRSDAPLVTWPGGQPYQVGAEMKSGEPA